MDGGENGVLGGEPGFWRNSAVLAQDKGGQVPGFFVGQGVGTPPGHVNLDVVFKVLGGDKTVERSSANHGRHLAREGVLLRDVTARLPAVHILAIRQGTEVVGQSLTFVAVAGLAKFPVCLRAHVGAGGVGRQGRPGKFRREGWGGLL